MTDPTATRPLDGTDLLHWSPDTATPDTPAMVRSHTGIPNHVETWLQRRYEHLAANADPRDATAIADDWRAVGDDLRAATLADATAADAANVPRARQPGRAAHAHTDHLATCAPGPPIRRGVDWWGIASTLAGIVLIVLAIVGTAVVLRGMAP